MIYIHVLRYGAEPSLMRLIRITSASSRRLRLTTSTTVSVLRSLDICSWGYYLGWRPFIAFLTGVKLRYLVGGIGAWNLWFALAIYLNGGQGKIRNPTAGAMIVAAVAVLTAAFFLLRWNESVQSHVLKPTADAEAVERFTTHMSIVLTAITILFGYAIATSVLPN